MCRYVGTSVRRYVGTSVRRRVSTSVRQHVGTSARRHAVGPSYRRHIVLGFGRRHRRYVGSKVTNMCLGRKYQIPAQGPQQSRARINMMPAAAGDCRHPHDCYVRGREKKRKRIRARASSALEAIAVPRSRQMCGCLGREEYTAHHIGPSNIRSDVPCIGPSNIRSDVPCIGPSSARSTGPYRNPTFDRTFDRASH